jgi:hypothetical protein
MIKSEEEWVVKKQEEKEEKGRRGVEMIRACNVNEDDRKAIQKGALPVFSVRVFQRLIAQMEEAVQTSETSVNSYQSTRRYNPEGSHLHTHRRENLRR